MNEYKSYLHLLLQKTSERIHTCDRLCTAYHALRVVLRIHHDLLVIQTNSWQRID